MSSADGVAGAALFAASSALLVAANVMKQRVSMQKELDKRLKQYFGEKAGRDHMEKELRTVIDQQLTNENGHFIQPIGYLRSCYSECVGTPRQGHLAPSTRAILELNRNISADAADQLDSFSHVWVVFQFHLNTNTRIVTRAYAGARPDSKRFTFKAKIHPPVLREHKGSGGKVGVFATRSPHRPNPIGITLARVHSVDAKRRCIHLRGVDLVDGTPVYDIKPYVPLYDTMADVRIADWIEDHIGMRNTVTISQEAVDSAHQLAGAMKLFKHEPDEYLTALRESIAADVRSPTQIKRALLHPPTLTFDGLRVSLQYSDKYSVEVRAIERPLADSETLGGGQIEVDIFPDSEPDGEASQESTIDTSDS